MGELQSRPVSLAGDQENRRENPPNGKRGGRVAVAVLSMVAVLGHATNRAGSARAQDTPAKKDAAAKADAPPESAPNAPSQESEPASAEALSVRYRFIERYSPIEDPAHPERLTQYRVGLLEKQKTEREKQQGAPDRFEIAWQTIYTERAAQVTKLGELLSAVRRYDRFKMDRKATTEPPKVALFTGLTIGCKFLQSQKPLILNLSDNERPLREFEYSQLTRQVFLTQLIALFPPTPRLVGDTWKIPARTAQYLVAEMPGPEDYEMTGTLIEVHKAKTGTALEAVIGVSGQLNLSIGTSALNAQIHFVFNAPPADQSQSGSGPASKPVDSPPAKSGRRRNEGITDARGYISRVLMAWKATNVLPDEEGRLKQTRTYELDLERRLSARQSRTPAAQMHPVAIPEPIPDSQRGKFVAPLPRSTGGILFTSPAESGVEPVE